VNDIKKHFFLNFKLTLLLKIALIKMKTLLNVQNNNNTEN